jgi:hypothetical protein
VELSQAPRLDTDLQMATWDLGNDLSMQHTAIPSQVMVRVYCLYNLYAAAKLSLISEQHVLPGQQQPKPIRGS